MIKEGEWPHSVFRKAIDRYGVHNQKDMLVEECAELIVAIKHEKRERVEAIHVMEEIADVWIMLNQIMMTYDKDTMRQAIVDKIKRIETRMNI